MIGRYTHSPTSRIVFGDNIGTLKFSDQTIKFEGNADKSATILFDFVAKQFDEHLRNLIAAEREACAKIADDMAEDVVRFEFNQIIALDRCAEAIRARGEK